jgi:hypothetical protein
MKVLELFSGSKAMSKPFKDNGHEAPNPRMFNL